MYILERTRRIATQSIANNPLATRLASCMSSVNGALDEDDGSEERKHCHGVAIALAEKGSWKTAKTVRSHEGRWGDAISVYIETSCANTASECTVENVDGMLWRPRHTAWMANTQAMARNAEHANTDTTVNTIMRAIGPHSKHTKG